eukprot:TRINITY_DN2626_c0_g4_i1.p1 TRINITY_DN2626_c0_g4~~TRINITY_DN2626_c0_g4_i1.p1  ORF type:complete len:407 (+),score=70.57 TRINITY_DN2626_c0_g4_i1:112-1332(+)
MYHTGLCRPSYGALAQVEPRLLLLPSVPSAQSGGDSAAAAKNHKQVIPGRRSRAETPIFIQRSVTKRCSPRPRCVPGVSFSSRRPSFTFIARPLIFCLHGNLTCSHVSLSTAILETDDGSAHRQDTSQAEENEAIAEQQQQSQDTMPWRPPRYVWRAVATMVMAGQVVLRVVQGRVHVRNTLRQLEEVGPGSLGVSLLTACFVGMAFTIQFVREFARLGLTRSIGGVLALALSRELSPVVTAIIMAGRVGSSFAAELGTMQVSEQTDTLRVLRTDPVDYLVTPRVLACCIALPVLTLTCFTVGMAASVLLADAVYNVSSNIILDSAARALQAWDLLSMVVKSVVFGGIIAGVSCSWGMTTQGGAKGVGESTTSAVVISLVGVFIADFALSWFFFQGAGDALKAALG